MRLTAQEASRIRALRSAYANETRVRLRSPASTKYRAAAVRRSQVVEILSIDTGPHHESGEITILATIIDRDFDVIQVPALWLDPTP